MTKTISIHVHISNTLPIIGTSPKTISTEWKLYCRWNILCQFWLQFRTTSWSSSTFNIYFGSIRMALKKRSHKAALRTSVSLNGWHDKKEMFPRPFSTLQMLYSIHYDNLECWLISKLQHYTVECSLTLIIQQKNYELLNRYNYFLLHISMLLIIFLGVVV